MVEKLLFLIKHMGILELSILFSLFIALFKVLQLQKKNEFLRKILKILEQKLFNYVVKNKTLVKFFKFAYKFTNNFFENPLSTVIYNIIMVSGLSLGISVCLRILMIAHYVIFGYTILLFFFAINAIFRSIITLGIHLNRDGIWHRLVSGKFKAKKNSKDRKNKESAWIKWGALGSIIGGFGSMVITVILQYLKNKSKKL